MKYPRVLPELETIERAHAGMNLARYGDGELKLALGGNCVSQPGDPKLAVELRAILAAPAKGCLPCIPNVYSCTPKRESWLNWARPEFVRLYTHPGDYGSSFVTRPDSAPWIDELAYWERVRDFWRGKDVALVAGTERSLRTNMMPEAASIRFMTAPSGQKGDGAYAVVDQLEEELATFAGPVLMCLGATATVLANRLAKRGVFAQDLGHIGMFMRSAGAYRFQLSDLISQEYASLLARKHQQKRWGADGHRHAPAGLAVAEAVNAETILDYGCGEQTLAAALKPRRVSGFDPGMTGKEGMPKPCDVLACTDVLEHVERDKLANVLAHMRAICLKAAYVVVSTRPAREVLADGRNAHLIVEDAAWWHEQIVAAGFAVERWETGGSEAVFWLRK